MKGITEFIVGVIYVAIVYTIVRPGSPASAVIKAVTDALTGIVQSATGYHQNGNQQ